MSIFTTIFFPNIGIVQLLSPKLIPLSNVFFIFFLFVALAAALAVTDTEDHHSSL